MHELIVAYITHRACKTAYHTPMPFFAFLPEISDESERMVEKGNRKKTAIFSCRGHHGQSRRTHRNNPPSIPERSTPPNNPQVRRPVHPETLKEGVVFLSPHF
jgi:hypothetical protein